MIEFEFEQHWEVFALTPSVVIQSLECECCEDTSGIAISLTFGFWSVAIIFGGAAQ